MELVKLFYYITYKPTDKELVTEFFTTFGFLDVEDILRYSGSQGLIIQCGYVDEWALADKDNAKYIISIIYQKDNKTTHIGKNQVLEKLLQ